MSTTVEDEDLDVPEVAEQTEEPEEPRRPMSLTVKVTPSGACRKHIQITVPRIDIDYFYESELKGLSDSAVVPGFRPGHIPQKLLQRRFKKELTEQVRQKILMESLDEVARTHKIDPINEPELDVKSLVIPDEGDFDFEFMVEVRPEFDLPNYRGLTITRPVRQITDDDVNRALARHLIQYAELTDRGGPAQAGDVLDVSGEFRHAGAPIGTFPRCGAQVVSRLRFQDAEIQGFDKLMQGVQAGETREVDVVVSNESPKIELRGEKIRVVFKIHKVFVRNVPTLDAALLTRMGVESEGELRSLIRAALERQLKYEQLQSARRQVIERITESADWELPEGAVFRQVENALRRDVLEMQQAGYTIQEIRAREAGLRQRAITSTRQNLKEHFVLDKVATAENITVEEADMHHQIAMMAEQAGENPRRVLARLIRSGQIENLQAQIRERKAIDVIFDSAVYKDVPTPARYEGDTDAISASVCGIIAAPVAEEAASDE